MCLCSSELRSDPPRVTQAHHTLHAAAGTYGKVVLCVDGGGGGGAVAVKIIRRHDRTTGSALYRAAALNEVRILRDLGGRHGTVLLLREFEHARHVCMAFEVLGDSLHDVLLARRGAPLEPAQARDVSHQVLNAVAYVHSRRVLHTDLKPENILLLPPGRAAGRAGPHLVKLIDFGTAIYDDAWHPPIVVRARARRLVPSALAAPALFRGTVPALRPCSWPTRLSRRPPTPFCIPRRVSGSARKLCDVDPRHLSPSVSPSARP